MNAGIGSTCVRDVVTVTRRHGDILVGTGNQLLRHHMEIRGLGIIDVQSMFGIRAIRVQKRVEIQVELRDWDATEDYDRTGLDQRRTEILGAAGKDRGEGVAERRVDHAGARAHQAVESLTNQRQQLLGAARACQIGEEALHSRPQRMALTEQQPLHARSQQAMAGHHARRHRHRQHELDRVPVELGRPARGAGELRHRGQHRRESDNQPATADPN